MINLVLFNLQYSREFFNLTDKNREYLRQWLPWLDTIKNEKDTIDFLQESISSHLEGTSLNYFILYNNNIIGTVGLRNIAKGKGIIGYWLDEEHQGRNIMSNAIKILINNIKDKKLINKIILRCSPENISSLSVAKKLNFKFKRKIKNAGNLYGKVNDLNIYEYYLSEHDINSVE